MLPFEYVYIHLFIHFFISFLTLAIPGYPNYDDRARQLLNRLNLKLPFDTEGLFIMFIIIVINAIILTLCAEKVFMNFFVFLCIPYFLAQFNSSTVAFL
jgi:hypothetical protein